MRRVLTVALAAFAVVIPLQISPASADFPWWPSSRWKWREDPDPITDVVQYSAVVYTTEVTISGSSTGHAAAVVLFCIKGDAALYTMWTSRVATQKNWQLEYRFKGAPGRTIKAVYRNSKTLITENLADIRQFLADARGSNGLFVRVISHSYNTSSANFFALGGREMVSRFVRVCPKVAPN